MAYAEINAFNQSLTKFSSTIQDSGNNCFLVYAAGDRYAVEVKLLQDKQKRLEEYVSKCGCSSEIRDAVTEAKKLVDKEEAELKRGAICKCCPIGATCGICSPVCGVLFPKSIGLSIQIVREVHDSILRHFDAILKFEEQFKRRGVIQSFYQDSHYVPLTVSEDNVFSALKNASPVVLLHGGPGKGKSTLVREVIIKVIYRKRESSFTQAVMLECGQNVDVAAKKSDLLRMIGCPESWGDDNSVRKLLQIYLRQDLLIVLDDLWECDLIHRLLESAPSVKLLITSRLGDLCDSVHDNGKSVVRIEDLSDDDSRNILATHAGFGDRNIPSHLKDVVNNIIIEAGGNALLLAQLGGWIANTGQGGRDNLEVWETLLDKLSVHDDELLKAETKVKLYGVDHQGSLLARMKSFLEALDDQQKQLLVLTSMCRSPSIPKAALHFLYSTAISHKKCDVVDFLTLSNKLKSKHFLDEKDIDYLSVHHLTRELVLKHLINTVGTVSELLKKAIFDPKGNAISDVKGKAILDVKGKAISNVKGETSSFESETASHAVVYLYIDTKWLRGAAIQRHPHSDPHISNEPKREPCETRRAMCSPIMKLLVLKARSSNKWTEELSECANQVLVDFVFKDLLRDGDISRLLQTQAAMTPFLTFLKNVSRLDKSFWEKNCIQSTLNSLHSLSLDQSIADPENKTQAVSVLADLESSCRGAWDSGSNGHAQP